MVAKADGPAASQPTALRRFGSSRMSLEDKRRLDRARHKARNEGRPEPTFEDIFGSAASSPRSPTTSMSTLGEGESGSQSPVTSEGASVSH